MLAVSAKSDSFSVAQNDNKSTLDPHPALEEARKQLSLSLSELRSLCETLDSTVLFTATAIFLAGPDSRLPTDALHLIPAKLKILFFVASETFNAPRDCTITEQHLARCINALDLAYGAQRSILCAPYLSEAVGFDTKSFLLASLAIETSMGVGAAEIDQTTSLIRIALGRFDQRFKVRLGISPTKAIEVLDAVVKALCSEPRLALLRRASDVWKRCWVDSQGEEDLSAFIKLGDEPFLSSTEIDIFPVTKSEVQSICNVSDSEWASLVSMIGCDPARRSQLKHHLDLIDYPLPVFSDGRVLIINLAGCLLQVFERCDSDAKSEPSFAHGKYQRHISDYLEINADACFQRLFPRESVFRGLIYPDPDRADGGLAELDIAVVWPPFLLICEAKSKQLRFRPIGADIARFCTDVKANIEDGFQQARRFAKYVDGVEEIILKEKNGGRTLKIDKSELRETFAVSISLRRMVSMAGQLATLQEMGLFKDGRFPWAVALDDLDIISRFSPNADVFLHFIKRRIMLEKEEVRYAGSEIDFFGTYLNSGRLEPEVWRHAEKRPNLITLTNYHERFQKAIHVEKMGVPVLAPVPLNVPPIVKDFLWELGLRSDDPQARWITFYVLSLEDQQLAALAYSIEALKASSSSSGRIRSAMLKCKDVVFSLTLSEERNLEQLHEITLNRAVSEKYRNKVNRCAAFGMEHNNPRQPFAHAFWLEDNWRFDPMLEKHVIQMKTRQSVLLPAGFKMPGRNEKCPCGSGKKFKYCCMGNYQAGKTSV